MFENEAKQVVNKLVCEDREWRDVLYEALDNLDNNCYDPIITDVIFQKSQQSNPLDLVDAYCFINIWTSLCAGEIVLDVIHIGHTPFKDEFREENRQILSTLEHPLYASLNPTHGKDGSLKWKESRLFQRTINKKGDTEKKMIEPSSVCLEVGSTNACTTFWHVFYENGVARWPYNQEYITILYRPKKSDQIRSFQSYCQTFLSAKIRGEERVK